MEIAALVTFIVFVGLLLGGVWVAYALGISGLILLFSIGGWSALNPTGLVLWGSTNNFILTAVPLFVLMGELLVRSKMSTTLYTSIGQWVHRLPGGLLHANIGGSAILSAISGSSMTTAMIMGRVAFPEMKARNYDPARAAGTLAAGGTLGILIPPSVAMILYGMMTDTSVAKLFMAGIIPGIVLTLLFMTYTAIISVVKPQKEPLVHEDPAPFGHRMRTLVKTFPILLLILAVLLTIYLGIATPTEAAALGVVGALIVGKLVGTLNLKDIADSLVGTVRMSAMIMMIVVGGQIFAFGIERAGVGTAIADWASGLGLSVLVFMVLLTVIYFVLGMFMDSIGLIIATVPVFFPVAMAFEINPIWFGIYMVLLIEVGQITPPMGLLCFVIQGVTGRPLIEIFRGVVPYVGVILLMLVLIAVFPQIVTFLPDLM